MKLLLTTFAICFSLTAVAGINSLNQSYSLDDTSALEYGFPHEIVLNKVEVKTELFGASKVRLVGTANGQAFDLVRKLKKIRGVENTFLYVRKIVKTIARE